MISFTNRFQDGSKRLVDRAGKQITYKHMGDATYDPDLGVVQTDVTITPKAFKVQANDSEIKSPNLIGKELSVFLIAGKDFTFVPKVGDWITYANKTESYDVRVQMIKEHWAGEEVSLYRLVCAAS